MEKRSFDYADRRRAAFSSYTFELDEDRPPAGARVSSPALLHLPPKRIDRRAHRRYPAARGAFALLRARPGIITDINAMTMGDIAFAVLRAQPAKIGQIVNISLGGLVFQYAPDARGSVKPSCLDILLADRRYYLDNLQFELVADIPAAEEFDFESVSTGLISVKFKKLTAEQMRQLKHFLKNHTLPAA